MITRPRPKKDQSIGPTPSDGERYEHIKKLEQRMCDLHNKQIAKVAEMSKKRHVSYEFSVKRNSQGFIETVIASPIKGGLT